MIDQKMLRGQSVLVVGGTHGIGLAIAEQYVSFSPLPLLWPTFQVMDG